jgi:NAD(P)H-dependent flavin oxidoreductase YrpB (nitropropane dioxygenase family)
MKSPICDMLGIEFPLVAFTHCRDVVVEVSKAGGMGVLGAAGLRPDQLETELAWIDSHIEGKPYGVDLIVPTSFASKGEDVDQATQVAQVPEAHKAFVHSLMASHGIDTSDLTDNRLTSGTRLGDNMQDSGANALLDVAFAHPIGLIANALGTPPAYMLERGKQAGVTVAALVGAREHAIKQVEAGVDILVVAGGEAGGHCGEVSTLVLVPEVAEAIRPYGNTPILAAGGIVTGRQMAACMAMGADGAWTGSVWLTTTEAETSPVVKEKMLSASSRQTVRSKARTGKYSRQLRSAWTDAWESEDAPAPLPMPLQSIVTEPAMAKITKLAEGGHEGARQLASYFVGQGVGLMNDSVSARTVVYEFMQDFLSASERLNAFLDD